MTKMTMTTTKRDCYVSRYGTVSVALQVFLCSFILLPSCSALECLSGWESGEIGDGGGKLVNIPEDWINDGYCDCPMDGKDEPDTNACSGSQYWPGIRYELLRWGKIFDIWQEMKNLELIQGDRHWNWKQDVFVALFDVRL